ncbi:MAG TPA: hypothetical protein VGT03_10350 [Candidatus Acidoferrales bacterium]|nr:hypothetical protein [Candidatus Acidoferrales bacterium]
MFHTWLVKPPGQAAAEDPERSASHHAPGELGLLVDGGRGGVLRPDLDNRPLS